MPHGSPPVPADPRAFRQALLVLAGATALRLVLAAAVPLFPDEAYYWDWSRHLDWSYYSKGPLVAWSIRASCELLGGWSERVTGNLTFAIRLPAVIYGSLLLASFYVLAVQVLGRPRLGLALVAKIVGEHGGIVECDSTPRGTTFRVLLPAWKGPSPALEPDEAGGRR